MLATITPCTDLRARALRSLSDLPPFSPVLNRLLATLAAEDVSIPEVSEIIEKDTIIAGNILKLVNSALYGRRGNVTSIPHASSLLGINRLRNAVLGMSLTRLWNQVRTPPDWSTARFNLHAVGVAIMSDLLAQRVTAEFPEGAFLAGLFHDLGRLLIALGLRDQYAQVLALYNAQPQPWTACEHQVLGFDHAELAFDALELWKLPEPIRLAAATHHHPERRDQEMPLGTYSLAQVVRCADLYVNSIGITVEKSYNVAAERQSDPFATLGIEDKIPELAEEFSGQYEALTVFFR